MHILEDFDSGRYFELLKKGEEERAREIFRQWFYESEQMKREA